MGNMANIDKLRLKVMGACDDDELSLFDDLVQASRCALYDLEGLEDVLAALASHSYSQEYDLAMLRSTIADLNDIFNNMENESGY
jgi:hypothetical protein